MPSPSQTTRKEAPVPPVYSLPQELEFARVDGVAHGRITALPEALEDVWRSIGCHTTWRANMQEVISMGVLAGHRVVTRKMILEILNGDEELFQRLTEGLFFDDSGHLVRGDKVLCIRSLEAREEEKQIYRERSLLRPEQAAHDEGISEEIDEVIAKLESEGFTLRENPIDAAAAFNRTPDPRDLVQVSKQPK